VEDHIEPGPPRFALFAKGFRPFFLLAAVWAVASVPLWLFVQSGYVRLGAYFIPTDWHAHEMVFGFAAAVIAGFLLTAAANWTKRETATGPLLIVLCLIWIAGRAALLASSVLPPALVAVANLAFLPALALVLGRAIVGAKSRRNYGIVVALVALFGAQLLSHVGALEGDILLQRRGTRLGVDLVLVLIAVIGGRVIPLFTRNATGATDIESDRRLDLLAIASVVAVGAADAIVLYGPILGVLAAVAAVLNALRMRRWGVQHTLREPMLWVLHAGYAFLPIGLALRALSELTPAVQPSAALHALTVGCIGLLTLGMMARVTLGHTGREIAASRLVTAAFVVLLVATVLRVAGPMLGPRVSTSGIHAAASAWSLAFLIYLVRLGPLLLRSRPDGKPG
jgi:uncharacterized protein involved in response to NO